MENRWRSSICFVSSLESMRTPRNQSPTEIPYLKGVARMSACVSQNDIRIISSDEGKKGGRRHGAEAPKRLLYPTLVSRFFDRPLVHVNFRVRRCQGCRRYRRRHPRGLQFRRCRGQIDP